MADKCPGWSQYNFCGDNPILNVDLDGNQFDPFFIFNFIYNNIPRSLPEVVVTACDPTVCWEPLNGYDALVQLLENIQYTSALQEPNYQILIDENGKFFRRQRHYIEPITYGVVITPMGMGMGGLRTASVGFQKLFAKGSVKNLSVKEIEQILLENGFSKLIADNGKGVRFVNSLKEEVRIMAKPDGSHYMRIQLKGGNYIDEFGRGNQGAINTHIELK